MRVEDIMERVKNDPSANTNKGPSLLCLCRKYLVIARTGHNYVQVGAPNFGRKVSYKITPVVSSQSPVFLQNFSKDFLNFFQGGGKFHFIKNVRCNYLTFLISPIEDKKAQVGIVSVIFASPTRPFIQYLHFVILTIEIFYQNLLL